MLVLAFLYIFVVELVVLVGKTGGILCHRMIVGPWVRIAAALSK